MSDDCSNGNRDNDGGYQDHCCDIDGWTGFWHSESGFDVTVGKKREEWAQRKVGCDNSAWECFTGLKGRTGEAWDLGNDV